MSGPFGRHDVSLPRYETRDALGEGASAVVYRAWDRELRRTVAVKVLRVTSSLTELARARFKREATAAASLVHPNVVAVYDAAEHEGRPYLVMEFIEGRTLSDLLKDSGTPARKLVGFLEQAARGVSAAHEKGIVHRDLKPANILVTASGQAKVADFGLAHLSDSETALTRSGAELGTPYYMSPEQVDGRSHEVTPATDVYAMGAILYEILSGGPPHARGTLQETYAAILSSDPPPLRSSHPDVPRDLETICQKALEKDPRRRYASALEFAEDLRLHLAGEPISAVPVPAWKRRARRLLKNRPLVAAAALLVTVMAAATTALVVQSVKAQRRLASERELAAKRESALQRLGTLQSTILDRGRELRLLRVPPEQARRDLEAALRDVDGFLREWPDSSQGRYVRARGRALLGDSEGAESDLRDAVAREPELRPAWTLLGILRIGEYVSKLEGATRTFEARVRSLAPVLDDALRSFARGWTSGKEREESARWGLAWTREDQVAERLARALELHYKDKKREAAIEALKDADHDYQAEEYALWLGLLAGPGEGRLRQINEALRRAPGFGPASYWRAASEIDRGMYREALADLERVLASGGPSAAAFEKRGAAEHGLRDLDGAVADYTRAVEIRPDYVEAFVHRGIAKAEQGKLDEAVADFDRALAIEPKNPQALANRGSAKQLRDDLEGALVDLGRAIEADPAVADSFRNRAIVYAKMNKVRPALDDLDRAIGLNPDYLGAYDLRARCREGAGDVAGAAKDYEQSLRLAPADWPRRKIYEEGLRRTRASLKDQ